MSLWKIAWRSIEQRALASTLTAVSMALGVSLVVAVLVIHSVVYQSFHRGGEGYDLIAGATKGSRLELVLASVYYIGQPVDNIPYSFYKNLHEGELSAKCEFAIPICLGDNYEGYRVVGTTPEMFEKLRYLGGHEYQFHEGRNFGDQRENYFEGVIGSIVARKTGLKLGETFRPTHDVAGQTKHKHPPFTVVGILEPSGTPNDRALFVNIEGFYRVGGHAQQSPLASGDGHGAKNSEAEEHEHEHEHDEHADVAEEAKRVTAVLIGSDPQTARTLAREINAGNVAQAAVPADEIARLFESVIGNVELVLLLFAVMIVLVAGIGIMVSIYNSMSDRRHEIAIMRALGAGRSLIMLVILMESILLSLGGGLLGLALGHAVIAAAGPTIAEQTGVSVGLIQFRTLELVLIPGLIALASVVGFLPAVAAYKTDVARSLTASP